MNKRESSGSRGASGASGALSRSAASSRSTRRRTGGSSSAVSVRAPAASTGASNFLRFYTEDSPGLRIGPNVVLTLSLLFIAFVVMLHIWGKFHR
mmetsp:Transcript_16151/g.26630  ORF Transcript_16151/g.26630 Transcript_16151/m.26630 type:complete len:95 (+) Transcript_16151:139-423(+)